MSWKHRVSKELAEKVVHMLHNITGSNVNFMGEGGEIIATVQKHRLGTIHEGARNIMEGKADFVAITPEQAQSMEGVLPGFNGPIELDGKRIGCIGMTGDPAAVEPLQKLAAIIVTEEIRKEAANNERQRIIEKVAGQIDNASATVQEIAAGAQEIAGTSQTMEASARKVEEQINNINEVLELVNNIVDQTNLLGLNAAIEAARAGEYGRGFSIVAQEVRKLSRDSASSLKNINEVLNQIKASILNITNGVSQNAVTTSEQAAALQHIETSIIEIQDEIRKLTK